MLHLHSCSLWKIVNSTETKPTNPANLEKWELRNITAQQFLIAMVDILISISKKNKRGFVGHRVSS